jgi:hypothetical protein
VPAGVFGALAGDLAAAQHSFSLCSASCGRWLCALVETERLWPSLPQLALLLGKDWRVNPLTLKKAVERAQAGFLHQAVDGLISVSAFGCAPDSVMSSVLTEAAQRANRPYMALVLDEHSGQAGLITRLEAFVDMLFRRKEKT